METKPSWIKGLLIRLCLIAVVVVGGWLLWLNARVVAQLDDFDWEIPAQVFSRPLEVYQGAPISAEQLESELQGLGYRPGSTQRAGFYQRSNQRIEVHTRGFRFPDGPENPQVVVLQFADRKVSAIQGPSVFRLEPALIGTLLPGSGEDREFLDAKRTPPLLSQGLIAVEDRRFDQHFGVDPRGLARAMWANVTAGRVVEGGSTLTQQLVKNLFLDRSRTLTRKLNEAAMALLVDWHYPKDFILQAYINQVYLGQAGRRAIHGFSKAARYWFARPLDELNASELALMVGLVKGPNAYHPRRNPERARQRRDAILAVWKREGLLTAAQFELERARPLGVSSRPGHLQGRYPGFMRLVRQELNQSYSPEALQTQGLQVFTTLDPWVQSGLIESLSRRLAGFEAEGRGQDLQGAGVVLAAGTGEVLAVVGDRAGSGTGFDRAITAQRPVGSLLKPLVYLHAFNQGYNALSPIADVPISVPTHDGQWSPQNYDRQFEGQVPLYYGLSKSKNLAAVNLAQALGFSNVAKTAQSAGLSVSADRPAWILGGYSMSPFEVARLYALFANDGFEVAPKLIRNVMAPDGTPAARYPTEPRRRLDSAGVYQLQQVLAQVMVTGTGRFVGQRLGRPSAGKSGTSNDQRDSWFAGFDAQHVGVVWVGNDDNSTTRLTGSSGAGLVWLDTMRRLNSGGLSFRQPAGIDIRWVDEQGRLSAQRCPNAQPVPLQTDRLPPSGECAEQPSVWQRVKQIFGSD